MRRSLRFGLVAAALCAATGCAINLSEARSARVLRGGEIQISEVNNVVAPTSTIADAVDPAKAAIAAVEDDRPLSDEEKRDIVRGATAIALSSPGYGAHLDIAVGLGYRIDSQLRIGNGVYGLSLRRGFDLGAWHASLGIRGAYNGGSSLVPYLDTIVKFVKVGGMRRFDGQAFGQLGTEFGEWGKLWLGGKWMGSWFKAKVDATDKRVDLGIEDLSGRIMYYGGFLGAAVGFRVIHFVVELNIMWADAPRFELFGGNIEPDGLIVAPTWGFQGTF